MIGTLLIAGGAMAGNYERSMRMFIDAAGGVDQKFAFVVAAGGEDPDETFQEYQDDFEKFGVKRENVVLVPLYAHHVVDKNSFNAMTGDHEYLAEILQDVRGVWFTGGDQYYIWQCFIRPDGTHTKALDQIHAIYQNGGAVGGSSAGAAIMSHVMIGEGNNQGIFAKETLFNYDTYDELCEIDDPIAPLIITRGFGFLKDYIVDQHFDRRPRLLRLIEACMLNREGTRVGLGISESTMMIIKENHLTVMGAGCVFITDCRKCKRLSAGSYSGVVMHALREGDSMDLITITK